MLFASRDALRVLCGYITVNSLFTHFRPSTFSVLLAFLTAYPVPSLSITTMYFQLLPDVVGITLNFIIATPAPKTLCRDVGHWIEVCCRFDSLVSHTHPQSRRTSARLRLPRLHRWVISLFVELRAITNGIVLVDLYLNKLGDTFHSSSESSSRCGSP